MHSGNEYLKELQGRYLMANSREEKSAILMSTAQILIRIESMLSVRSVLFFPQGLKPDKGESKSMTAM